VITTASSGMKLQNEHGLLNDNIINDSCDSIYNSAEYLSQTINDFRSFFNQNKQKTIFDIKDIYNNTFKLLIAKFRNKNIKVYSTLNRINISGSENELIQVLMNILNNATDALELKENDKFIFIEIYKNNNDAIIKIKDNASGIPQDILSKIFDAHFTTKQNTNATGIGLYMSQKIIIDSFQGTIEVSNIDYEYDGKNYTGAEFVITLPLSSDVI
jgi:signal transduction histidine kinase